MIPPTDFSHYYLRSIKCHKRNKYERNKLSLNQYKRTLYIAHGNENPLKITK